MNAAGGERFRIGRFGTALRENRTGILPVSRAPIMFVHFGFSEFVGYRMCRASLPFFPRQVGNLSYLGFSRLLLGRRLFVEKDQLLMPLGTNQRQGPVGKQREEFVIRDDSNIGAGNAVGRRG